MDWCPRWVIRPLADLNNSRFPAIIGKNLQKKQIFFMKKLVESKFIRIFAYQLRERGKPRLTLIDKHNSLNIKHIKT